MFSGYNLLSNLLFWLVYQFPVSYLRLAVNLPRFLSEIFGIDVQFRYYFIPMFHDTSWVGRGLSLFFRTAIIFGGSVIVLVSVLYLWILMPFVFIALPILAIYYQHWIGLIWILLFTSLVVWRLLDFNKPWIGLVENTDLFVLRSLPGNLARLVSKYPDNWNEWWDDPEVLMWCMRLEIDVNSLKLAIQDGNAGSKKELVDKIIFNSNLFDTRFPEIGEVMTSLAEIDLRLQKGLKQLNVSIDQVIKLNGWLRRIVEWTRVYAMWDERYEVMELAGVNRAFTATPTPILRMFSYDMTMNASMLPQAVDRENERNQVLNVLSKEGNKHVIIIGDTGTGKTTFVGGLAQTIMRGGAPKQIANKRLLKLEPGRLVSGAKTQGELTERLVGAMDEAKRSGDIILFIDEIHTLMTEQSSVSGLNLFTVLEEFLFDKQLQMIGVTSVGNYKKYIEPNQAFARLFEVVKLEEPNDAEALEILENIVLSLEKKHNAVYSLQSIEAAILLSKRYIHDRVLPDKAKTVLDDAGLDLDINLRIVSAETVARVMTRLTGVPVTTLGEQEKKMLLNLEKKLHEEYVNQDIAVKALSDAMRRGRMKVGDFSRPIGVFMFVGPTGVGKTELSRRLSEVYFGSEKAMIRIDMGEFSSERNIFRLIGAAPGEQGYGEGGELTEQVRRQPFALILLDEIEKANPKVWNLLLQLIDEGKLSDSSGLEVDFTNTIIVCTSNAVTRYITEQLDSGKSLINLKKLIFDELLNTFRIEFLNRFDGIIPFGPLDEKHMRRIVEIQLDKLKKRLKEKHVNVRFTDSIIKELAKQGTDPRLGARPLRRIIQDKIESKLAIMLLEAEDNTSLEIELDKDILT